MLPNQHPCNKKGENNGHHTKLNSSRREIQKRNFRLRRVKHRSNGYDCRIEIEKLRSENAALKKEIESLRSFKDYFNELYQKGIGFSDWQHNGDIEPFDNFYESALDHAGLS